VTLPVLPRAKLGGTVGFFFCGMIEEPVQKRSAAFTKPNRGLVHRISSSDRRDRWTIASAAQAQNSIAKSRSDTASMEFSANAFETQLSRHARAVDRERGPRERRGAEREPVHSSAQSASRA